MVIAAHDFDIAGGDAAASAVFVSSCSPSEVAESPSLLLSCVGSLFASPICSSILRLCSDLSSLSLDDDFEDSPPPSGDSDEGSELIFIVFMGSLAWVGNRLWCFLIGDAFLSADRRPFSSGD